MRPVLGHLLGDVGNVRNLGGLSGESYVDKDLRTLLGHRVRGKFQLSYCGKGSLTGCRESLWAALDQTVRTLSADQGNDPTKWRSVAARSSFAPGLIPDTFRATNRPTFQQVLELSRH